MLAPRINSRPTFERIMRIHEAIRSGDYPNAATLARTFEVSSKTIQKDLQFMRDRLDLPLAYDARRYGYHYEKEVTKFPIFQVTEGELFALLVAEKALQQYRGTNLEKPLMSAFQKIAALLPETVSLTLEDWDQTISFRTSAEPLIDREIFEELAHGASSGERLILSYRKAGTREGEKRVIDPYHIANINGEWYLFAYCHLRKDIRTFVPGRIKGIERTGKKFVRPQKFSLEKRLQDSFGVHSGEGQFRVVVQFNEFVADYIREKKWHASQKITELREGGVELELKLSSLMEVQRWLLGWGANALVIEPPALLAGLRQSAEAIAAQYRPCPSPGAKVQPQF